LRQLVVSQIPKHGRAVSRHTQQGVLATSADPSNPPKEAARGVLRSSCPTLESSPPWVPGTLPNVDTICTALSLMPTVNGNTFAASLRTDISPQRKEARPRLTL
jgi:hypothetical protein